MQFNLLGLLGTLPYLPWLRINTFCWWLGLSCTYRLSLRAGSEFKAGSVEKLSSVSAVLGLYGTALFSLLSCKSLLYWYQIWILSCLICEYVIIPVDCNIHLLFRSFIFWHSCRKKIVALLFYLSGRMKRTAWRSEVGHWTPVDLCRPFPSPPPPLHYLHHVRGEGGGAQRGQHQGRLPVPSAQRYRGADRIQIHRQVPVRYRWPVCFYWGEILNILIE